MKMLNNWPTEAVHKLESEKSKVTGAKEKAMSGAVFAALKDFCLQDTEFAQAVAQGGSFADCMKAVAKGVGQSISDLEAYKKAVAFYFPGAKIHMTMRHRTDKTSPVIIAQIHGYHNDNFGKRGHGNPSQQYAWFLDAWMDWLAHGSKRDKSGKPVLPKTKEVTA